MLTVHNCTCVVENILNKVFTSNNYTYFMKKEGNVFILYYICNSEVRCLNSLVDLQRLMSENFTKEQILKMEYKGNRLFIDNHQYAYTNNHGGIEIIRHHDKLGNDKEYTIHLDDGIDRATMYFSKEEMLKFVEVINLMSK